MSAPASLPAISPITALRRTIRSRSCCRIRCAWVESCLAIARAGAISVPISYDSTEAEIAYRLDGRQLQSGVSPPPSAAICSRGCKPPRRNLKTLIVTDRGSCSADGIALRRADRRRRRSRRRAIRASLHETAFILYTSGTTGRAKGVRLTVHGMLWVTAACWTPITGLTERDTVLSPLPLFHSYALNLSVLSILATGASEYIMEKFSTSEAVRLLKSGEFTYFPGVPTMFHYLLQATRGEDQCAISQSAALCFRRRHHAGDAQSRIRNPSRRTAARRLRHHRNLDHGHDELADRRPRHGLVRHSGAGARGADRRSQRPKTSRRARKAN